MHIFKYSPRKGTRAADMENQIDGNVKEERSKKLIELDLKNEKEFIEKYIETEIPVLFEQKVKNEQDLYEGYTHNYIKVIVCSKEKNLIGKIIKVKINDAGNGVAYGEIID
jgi:threonylcarbamoyladenosine tRNA methylthiotransferase MtaB